MKTRTAALLVLSLLLPCAAGFAADGSLDAADGSLEAADGSLEAADGSLEAADGSLEAADGSLEAADGSVEKRLHVLEAKEDIRTLIFNDGRYVDDRNWEAFAALFATDGGTWNGGMGVARGHDEIVQMMSSTIGNAANTGINGSGLSNLHLLGNEIISVDGDTGTALSKWVFVMTAEDHGPDVVFVGRYNDEFIRENGVWKFKLRTVTSDIARPVQLPGLENGN